MEFDLCKIDWIAISAIATAVMVFFTWRSLHQTKLQWEKERRPHLVFSIEVIQQCYVLKISNTGKLPAFNIQMKFNESFINKLPEPPNENAKQIFEELQTKFYTIEAGNSKKIGICACRNVENIYKNIEISGKYCDRYIIKENLSINEYMPSL